MPRRALNRTPADRLLACLCLSLGLGLGCAGTSVSVEVERPALIPADTFPFVFIATDHDRDAVLVAQDVVLGLTTSSDSQARRVTIDELDSIRFPEASVIVELSLALRELSRPRSMTTRPCVPGECDDPNVDRFVAAALRGVGSVKVFLVQRDGTRELAQEAQVNAYDEGRDYESMRARVVGELSDRVYDLFVTRREEHRVRLYPVSTLPEVGQAIALAAQGEWISARRLLEPLRREARSLGPPSRARYLYALGVIRRFANREAEVSEARLAAAERALRAAIQLDPRQRYADALEELLLHREHLRNLAAQEDARAHNFGIAAPREEIPVPDGYAPVQPSELAPAEPEGETAPASQPK